MIRRIVLVLVVLGSLLVPAGATAAPLAADCQFVLGFKTLHDLIPQVVGDCKTNEQYNPQNGDSLQETTRGLLVWRKVDNWTAFTDGYRTWINGPNGIQQRLNTERFSWEKDPVTTPTPAPASPPAPTYAWRAQLVSWASNCGTTFMYGHVYDRNGNPVDGISVKSWNDWGNEYIIGSGSDPNRGTGAWVRLVNKDNNPQTWYVAIVDGAGNLASQPFTVRFDADCGSGAQEVVLDFHES